MNLSCFGGFRCQADDPAKPHAAHRMASVVAGEAGSRLWGPRACPWGSILQPHVNLLFFISFSGSGLHVLSWLEMINVDVRRNYYFGEF
jgi:hypothetical protein